MEQQQEILSAIENLTRTVATLQGDMKDMSAALAKIQEPQGPPDSHGASVVDGDETELPSQADLEATDGTMRSNPEPLMIAENEMGEEMGSPSAEPESERVAMADETAELEEAVADHGQADEEGPGMVAILAEGVQQFEAHSAEEEPPAEGETPHLADALDSTGDMLGSALSEIRMMMDRLRFAKGGNPEQHEQLMQEIAATREGVLALDAMVTELRVEVRSGREALATIQAAMPDSTALNELHGLVVEQNRCLETELTQLVRGSQDTTQEALSKGTADLGNYLGAELAKLSKPLTASQEAMGQVLGSVSVIDGMKSKLTQTWGVSLFWLSIVVIYILIRGALSFWG